MTGGQRRTVRVLGALLGALLLLSLGALGWEFYSLTLHDEATISETIWVLWVNQPGPIALCLATVAFWVGVLCGHFFWQSRRVYESISERQRARIVREQLGKDSYR